MAQVQSTSRVPVLVISSVRGKPHPLVFGGSEDGGKQNQSSECVVASAAALCPRPDRNRSNAVQDLTSAGICSLGKHKEEEKEEVGLFCCDRLQIKSRVIYDSG